MIEQSPEVRLLAPAARFVLQGGAAARAAAGRAFGTDIPEESCRAHAAVGRAALWLGPDERLLIAPAAAGQAAFAELAAALAGMPQSLVDVSDRQVGLSITGRRSSAWLNSGCPLDLDPGSFPPGMCTRTLLAKAEVVLWRRSAEEYHLEVPRSFLGYVLGWLREAGHSEFHE